MLVDPDGRLVAIDHGLCFPWRTNPHEGPAKQGFTSAAFKHLTHPTLGNGGKLDPKILDHLKTVKKDDLMGVMRAHKLEKEGEHCWMRLQALLEKGKLERGMDHASVWYKSGGVK